MSVVDVIKSCYDSIEQIAEHIEDAIIYTDAGCTESFQFIGAYPLLVEHGARAVCSLENLSPLHVVANMQASSERATKLVIMTSRLLSDAHRYILRCLIMYQGITHCFIYTSISEAAHSAYPDMPLGPDAFHEYESLLLQDYEELLKKHNQESGVPEERKNGEDLASDERWPKIDDNAISDRVNSPVAGVMYGDDTSYQESDEKKLIVSVSHFPMIYCALSPKTFVLPSGGSVAEASLSTENVNSLSPGLPPLSLGVSSNGEDAIPGATLTAHFLHHFASKMDLKLEIFSFGDLSKTVGKILTDMPSLYDMGRRKKSAGLLVVDRTLDLLTPCCHGDSFFDRIFSALPRREELLSLSSTKSVPPQPKQNSRCIHRTSLDVQIPLDTIVLEDSGSDKLRLLEGIEAILCGWNSETPQSKIQGLLKLGSKVNHHKSFDMAKNILKGSFVSAEHFRGTPYLEAVLDRKMKDGTILVKKWLQETLRKDNIATALRARPGSATKPELEALLKALVKSDHSLLRNKGIAQLAAATLACLDEAEAAQWDALMSAEKMLKISAGDTSQNLAAQMVDLINKTILTLSQQKNATSDSFSQGLISFQDALLLTCIGYILAGENFPTSGSSGPFSWQEEHLLKEAIVDAIFENPEAAELKFIHGIREELKAYRSRTGLKTGKEKEPQNELSIDDFDDDQWGKWGDEEDGDDGKEGGEESYNDMQLKLELRDRVDNLFRFLHKLSSLKVNSIPLREASLALDAVSSGDFYEQKGLLYKILTTVLAKRDLPGLEHHSSAVGRLFKSGFGRLGLGQAKPNLADQNVIFIFVVGGLNGLEVKEAFEALSESGRPDVELIMGGTTLLTPGDMHELLLGDMSFF